MLCNGPEQELLFPICRTIRRLVDEGKPAVVSTAELFETKMKVLENVTGLRLFPTKNRPFQRSFINLHFVAALLSVFYPEKFVVWNRTQDWWGITSSLATFGGFAGEKGWGEISTTFFEARDIYIYKLPANDESLNISQHCGNWNIYIYIRIRIICCCIFSYLIGYRWYSVFQSIVCPIRSVSKGLMGKQEFIDANRRLFEIAQIFQMARLFVSLTWSRFFPQYPLVN